MRRGTASDLTYEAAAFLTHIGQGARVPPSFVRATLDAQLPDGGWGWTTDETTGNWHSTGLAAFFLHERIATEVHDSFSASRAAGARTQNE